MFIGIESPSAESLKETKKFQNLRRDPLDSIRLIQQHGLWVMGGFIVGFDSDPPDIFDRQIEFIERAAIPWAMTGVLQAPPTTPLYERMGREGRLLQNNPEPSNFDPPNFRTVLPLPELLDGTKRMLLTLYDPRRFYERGSILWNAGNYNLNREPRRFLCGIYRECCLNLLGSKACSRAIVKRIGVMWDGSCCAGDCTLRKDDLGSSLRSPVTTSSAMRGRSPSPWKLKAAGQFSSCNPNCPRNRMDKRGIWCRSTACRNIR